MRSAAAATAIQPSSSRVEDEKPQRVDPAAQEARDRDDRERLDHVRQPVDQQRQVRERRTTRSRQPNGGGGRAGSERPAGGRAPTGTAPTTSGPSGGTSRRTVRVDRPRARVVHVGDAPELPARRSRRSRTCRRPRTARRRRISSLNTARSEDGVRAADHVDDAQRVLAALHRRLVRPVHERAHRDERVPAPVVIPDRVDAAGRGGDPSRRRPSPR